MFATGELAIRLAIGISRCSKKEEIVLATT
jgi:hypothetical protein